MAASKPATTRLFPTLAAMLVVAILTTPSVVRGASDDDDAQPTSEYSLARQAMSDGDYDLAIDKLTRLHEKDPNDADVLNMLGYGHRKAGNFDQARGYYLQALAIEPEHRGASEYLGELYLETGQLDKAEERLAVLDKDCWLGCEEYTELKEAIEKYKTQNGIK